MNHVLSSIVSWDFSNSFGTTFPNYQTPLWAKDLERLIPGAIWTDRLGNVQKLVFVISICPIQSISTVYTLSHFTCSFVSIANKFDILFHEFYLGHSSERYGTDSPVPILTVWLMSHKSERRFMAMWLNNVGIYFSNCIVCSRYLMYIKVSRG